MTRLIGEPSDKRDISNHEYRVRQLERRPEPITGAGTMPWARRSMGFDASNQSISNNTNTNVTMNHDYNMGTGESGEAYFEAASNGINILLAGVYAITAEVYWFDTMQATWAMTITSDNAAWPHTVPGYFEPTGGVAPSGQGLLSFVHRYNPDNVAALLQLTVYQRTGGSKNLDAAYLEIVRLGDYTGTDFTDMDPNQ